MTEYIIVFPVMLVLIFGTLQFALLYQTKIQLNYAAFEAARTGALNHAQRWALNAGAVRGLVPLHTHGSGREWLRWARSTVWDQIDAGLLEVEILSPSAEVFGVHGIDEGDGPFIPNDNLMYRDATPQGAPGGARLSIQDANLLKIRLLYCVDMPVPFVNRMINSLLRINVPPPATPAGPSGTVATGQLSAWTNTGAGYVPPDVFENTCLNRLPQRHIPLASEATIRMHTAPIFDPIPAPP